MMGLGAFIGNPSESSKGWEKGSEIFYRMQLTQALDLTYDLQYWNRRDAGLGTTDALIFGLRLLWGF